MSNNYLFRTANQEIGISRAMPDRTIIAANVKRLREAADMSQADLAKAIGVSSANTIGAIETGGTKKSKYLHDIARVLKVRITDIDPSQKGEETLIVPAPMSETEQIDQLTVYASAECGDGIIVLSNEPMTHIPRPRPLIGVRGGYGVLVVGESMTPVIRPGYTVWVHPHLPARVGDPCLFRHDEHGEFQGTIKEYCGQTAETWLVRRYQPKERRFALKKSEWPICHVIVGTDYGR